MVSFRPLNGVIPLINGRTPWLINGGDPNYLLTGMILQVDPFNWQPLESWEGENFIRYTGQMVFLTKSGEKFSPFGCL